MNRRTVLLCVACLLASVAAAAFVLRRSPTDSKTISRLTDDILGEWAVVVEKGGKRFLVVVKTEIPWNDKLNFRIEDRPTVATEAIAPASDWPLVLRMDDKFLPDGAWRFRDGAQVFPK